MTAAHVADAFVALALSERTTGHVVTVDGGNVEASALTQPSGHRFPSSPPKFHFGVRSTLTGAQKWLYNRLAFGRAQFPGCLNGGVAQLVRAA